MAEEIKKTCDGHCETCGMSQRTYCAAQMAYYNQKEIAEIKAKLEAFYGSGVNPIPNEKDAVKTEENDIEQDIA